MPLFIFLSGAVVSLRPPVANNPDFSLKAATIKTFQAMAHSAERLLIPFVVWTIIGWVMQRRGEKPLLEWICVVVKSVDYSLWFLLTIFYCIVVWQLWALGLRGLSDCCRRMGRGDSSERVCVYSFISVDYSKNSSACDRLLRDRFFEGIFLGVYAWNVLLALLSKYFSREKSSWLCFSFRFIGPFLEQALSERTGPTNGGLYRSWTSRFSISIDCVSQWNFCHSWFVERLVSCRLLGSKISPCFLRPCISWNLCRAFLSAGVSPTDYCPSCGVFDLLFCFLEGSGSKPSAFRRAAPNAVGSLKGAFRPSDFDLSRQTNQNKPEYYDWRSSPES